jgi:hypothetical protein
MPPIDPLAGGLNRQREAKRACHKGIDAANVVKPRGGLGGWPAPAKPLDSCPSSPTHDGEKSEMFHHGSDSSGQRKTGREISTL